MEEKNEILEENADGINDSDDAVCDGISDDVPCEPIEDEELEEYTEENDELPKDETPKERARLGRGGKIFIAALVLIAVLALAASIYSLDYYRADASAEALMADGTSYGSYTVFDGGGDVGFIFYPGGKVEHSAYAPLMKLLADNGITAVLVEMPLKLAVLNADAWEGARRYAPKVNKWYIGGHSLGGAMAADALDDDEIAGLVLLGAYATDEVKVPTLSIYGSEDGVMQRDKYEAGLKFLAGGVREHIIEGGNHAGFGSYGEQDGDGRASISGTEQLTECAAAIIEFCSAG